METKPFWQSWTFYASIITAIAPVIPPIAVFAAANPQLYHAILAALFMGLRAKTDTGITLGAS